ncbi:MAG TPA: glycosyltransferase family 39 protein [Pyrinomonadaceae bacterium]|jgi:tetratricopeptide (TPR) repeat protein
MSENFSPMSEPRRAARISYWLIAALCFGTFAFQLWYSAVRTSAIVDEPAHILAGHRHWQCGDFGINPEHPPMLKMLASAPLELRTLNDPPWQCGSRITSKPDLFLHGTKFVIQNGIDDVIIPARLTAALFAVALAALVFAFVRRIFGRAEALTALALFAFEPNLLANAALVTTDMTLAATAFAAVTALYAFCRKPSGRRFLLAGLAIGLLLAAKHSAVIFVPILFVLTLADALIFGAPQSLLAKRLFRRAVAFGGIFLIGLTVLWAFYGFRYRALPQPDAATVSVAEYIVANGRLETADSKSAKIVARVAEWRIFPESYTLGLADIVATNSRLMVLFDRAYPTGQWFYFPVSFMIKSSVALLLLLPLGFLFSIFNPEKRREMMFLLAPPVAFFAVALTSGINIGVRHILPVYPFFIVAAAVGAVWMSRRARVFRYFLIMLIFYHALTAIRTAPEYLAFANDFWGGTENSYRYFRDPNLDYGQNIKFVKEYVEREGITDCWAALAGNIELTIASQPCRTMPGSFPLSTSDQPQEPVPPVIEGTVIIAAQVMPPRGGAEYVPIIQTEPIARIGAGVFVYRGRFQIPLVAALSHAERANHLIRLNRLDEAVADASKAVELAPADARTRLALARSGQRDAARGEFEKTIEAARVNPVYRNAEVRARQELRRLEGK